MEKTFLAQAGITPDEYVLYDGSGMSRQNLTAPRAATKLLEYIHQQPWAELFKNTLPVAGMDGTLSDRMKNTSAEGRVFAKTGTLLHVHALSGYAQTLSGDTLAFSILCNNHNLHGSSAVAVIDRIVEALVDDALRAVLEEGEIGEGKLNGQALRLKLTQGSYQLPVTEIVIDEVSLASFDELLGNSMEAAQ